MPVYGPDVTLNDPAFIHETALIYGKVTINKGASVWPYVVMRAENHEITVGEYTNIQDFSMFHVGGGTPTHVGSHCSITHHCTIHGCTIGNNVLVGINAVVADGSVVGDNCIIGQNAFVREGQKVPDNSIVVGVPAQVKSTRNNLVANKMNAFLYYQNAKAYAEGHYRRWDDTEIWQLAASEMEEFKKELAELEAADKKG